MWYQNEQRFCVSKILCSHLLRIFYTLNERVFCRMRISTIEEKELKQLQKIRESSKASPNECDSLVRRRMVKLVSWKKNMEGQLANLSFFVSKKSELNDFAKEVCYLSWKQGFGGLHNFGEITRFSAFFCFKNNGLVPRRRTSLSYSTSFRSSSWINPSNFHVKFKIFGIPENQTAKFEFDFSADRVFYDKGCFFENSIRTTFARATAQTDHQTLKYAC